MIYTLKREMILVLLVMAPVFNIYGAIDMDHHTIQNHLLIKNSRTSKTTMSDKVEAYDPINHESYEKVLLGAVQRSRNPLRRFDFWRYVTVYNIEEIEERVAYLPYFEEDCHDNSFFMGEWGESRSLMVTLSSGVAVSKLGLSTSVGMSIENGTTFSTNRRIKAIEGIRARHYPIKVSETFRGATYIQTFDSKTGGYGFLKPSHLERLTDGYPYPFYIDNQNLGMRVRREIIERCPVLEKQSDEEFIEYPF